MIRLMVKILGTTRNNMAGKTKDTTEIRWDLQAWHTYGEKEEKSTKWLRESSNIKANLLKKNLTEIKQNGCQNEVKRKLL